MVNLERCFQKSTATIFNIFVYFPRRFGFYVLRNRLYVIDMGTHVSGKGQSLENVTW